MSALKSNRAVAVIGARAVSIEEGHQCKWNMARNRHKFRTISLFGSSFIVAAIVRLNRECLANITN